MDSLEKVKGRIDRFIQKEILVDEGLSLAPNISLVEEGILDSFGILKMASFLENEFNIQLSPMDLTLDNFETVERIAEHAWKKLRPV